MNSFNKTNYFITNDKFADKHWKCIISEEKKENNKNADKDLSSWQVLAGPDMTEVRVLV